MTRRHLFPSALVVLLAAGCSEGSRMQGPQSNCPVPVCRYQGTAWSEERLGNTIVDRGAGTIVWTFSHRQGREAVYVASGEVTALWRSDHCSITLEPAKTAIVAPSDISAAPRLWVDFSTTPVRYSIHGSSEWAGTQEWSCSDSHPFTVEGVTTKWVHANDQTSSDPGLLKGVYEWENGRSGWEFRNSP